MVRTLLAVLLLCPVMALAEVSTHPFPANKTGERPLTPETLVLAQGVPQKVEACAPMHLMVLHYGSRVYLFQNNMLQAVLASPCYLGPCNDLAACLGYANGGQYRAVYRCKAGRARVQGREVTTFEPGGRYEH